MIKISYLGQSTKKHLPALAFLKTVTEIYRLSQRLSLAIFSKGLALLKLPEKWNDVCQILKIISQGEL